MRPQNNRITQSIIVGLVTLVATFSWSALKRILEGDQYWFLAGLGFWVLLIFLSLNWLFSKSRAVLLTTIGFVLVSFFLSFGFRLEYLAALFLAFLLFWFGSQRAISEKNVRIKIRVWAILRCGLPLVVTGLSLVIATACYFSPLFMSNQIEIKIPRPLFNIIFEPFLKTAEGQLPLKQFSEQFGLSLEANTNLEDLLYQAANQEINKYSRSYQRYFPFGLALGVFLALKTVGFFFAWLVILLSWLIFKILVSLGAIKIQEQAVLKEVIEL